MRVSHEREQGQDGFMLVGLIVAIFMILLVLGVAAPRVAKALRRDREVEAIHRGNQYVRAVQLFYRKTGHYPGSLEQLEKTNNIRFLRQRYADPMTGKPDWRLIHVGEAKTTVKGFFGKPLAGLPGAGGFGSPLGSVSGAAGAGAGATGSSFGGAAGSSSFGSGAVGGAQSGSTASPGVGGGSSGSSGSSFGSAGSSGSFGSSGSSGAGGIGGSTGIGSQSATSFSGTGAPIMGISSVAMGESIVVLNEQTTYPTWEFIYDPRIEQLKAKTGLGSASGASGSGIGGSSIGTPIGGSSGAASTGGATPPGTTPGTGGSTPTPAPTLPQ